jgi:hypothetical protein
LSPKLTGYLAAAYRRDILHESVQVMPLSELTDVEDEIKAEIARIDGLRLGASLAQRDFVSYHTRKMLVELQNALKSQGDLKLTEDVDKASFAGHN